MLFRSENAGRVELSLRVWSWLRRKVSYKAFEDWVHHLFEDGMAWTFRKCRTLPPGGALLVILLAIVWIPISFTAATAVHAFLIAEAHSLPKWMQVFHAVAALLAKSKLLLLPAYPAAWPQAKKHPIVEAGLRVCRFIAKLRFVDKMQYRFGQTEGAMDRAAERMGVLRAWKAAVGTFNKTVAAIVAGVRAALRPLFRLLAKLPLMGSVMRSYASQYDRAGQPPPQRLSQRVKAFFQRWEIKFTPAYYEAREKVHAAPHAAAPAPPAPAAATGRQGKSPR